MNITRRVTETVDFEYMKAAIDAGNGPEFVRPFDELVPAREREKHYRRLRRVCGRPAGPVRAQGLLAGAPRHEQEADQRGRLPQE